MGNGGSAPKAQPACRLGPTLQAAWALAVIYPLSPFQFSTARLYLCAVTHRATAHAPGRTCAGMQLGSKATMSAAANRVLLIDCEAADRAAERHALATAGYEV